MVIYFLISMFFGSLSSSVFWSYLCCVHPSIPCRVFVYGRQTHGPMDMGTHVNTYDMINVRGKQYHEYRRLRYIHVGFGSKTGPCDALLVPG